MTSAWRYCTALAALNTTKTSSSELFFRRTFHEKTSCSLLKETTSKDGAVVQDQRQNVFLYLPHSPKAAIATFKYVTQNWETLWNSCVVVNVRPLRYDLLCSALRFNGMDVVVDAATANFNTPMQLDMVSIQ